MSFAIDDAYLPATLNCHPMTDEEFMAFCQEHPDLNFEMTAEGELIVMAPTHPLTGTLNLRIGRYLDVWTESDGRGIGYDSSTGFVLPNGARRSPDLSWVFESRVPLGNKGFLHLCPDFVIELKSSSDRLPKLKAKMREYMANGAQLGWLIHPEKRTVIIYRPNAEPETRIGIDSIEGEGPVEGFKLDLRSIWERRK
jgi:Uma2 family endonuclease